MPTNFHERLNFHSLFTKGNFFQFQGISEPASFFLFFLSLSLEKFTDISRFDRGGLTPERGDRSCSERDERRTNLNYHSLSDLSAAPLTLDSAE